MQSKSNTDIDRKLAIYYHPLFQEILSFIAGLFGNEQPLTLGLLEFLQFNLKLQKCLLPTFETDNAVVSGLNDWVKEVAECLSFEGMVSTAGCTQVTPDNIMQLISKEIKCSRVRLLLEEQEYKQFLKSFITHDAFKLLGVRINSEVFCKFLFDLCTTWCEFLDVEIFVYFLLTLALQISEGSTLYTSSFKSTRNVRTVQLDFFEDFEQLKSDYNKSKRKDLRYYRAWCEWNYLRMNEIGEKVILDLNDIFSGDERIQSLTQLFEKAIDTINVQITNQIKEEPRSTNADKTQTKQFLVFKKLDVKRSPLPQRFNFIRSDMPDPQPEERHDYEVTIDEQGNMYLKKIVKIPILGSKISPLPLQLKQPLRMQYLTKKKDQYREMSNLYRMDNFEQALPHNSKLGPYHYEKSKLVQQIEQFEIDRLGKSTQKKVTEIHRRKHEDSKESQSKEIIESRSKPTKSLYSKQQQPSSDLSMDYDNKTLAPVFLTNKAYNISYGGNYQQYGKRVGAEKRNLQTNLPRVLKQDPIIGNPPTHLIGRFITDRRKIRDKITDISQLSALNNSSIVKVASTHESVASTVNNDSKIEKLKESNKHIWSRYMSEQEMHELTDFKEFYEKLYRFKKMFTEEFRSDYVRMIHLELEYEDTRHDMGGVITKEVKEKFSQRMQKLIARDDRKKRRRKKRRGVAFQHSTKRFRNGDERQLFNHVFLDYHRSEIQRARQHSSHNSVALQ